jgi:hypothetical protein
MSNAEKYVALLNGNIGALKTGSLRFWGLWFGKPYDNIHRIVSCDNEQDLLRIRFNESELLSVWSPDGLEANSSTFRIADAARVRWEWYSYGKPNLSENVYFEDYPEGVRGTSNANWYEPKLDPLPGYPAVEMY